MKLNADADAKSFTVDCSGLVPKAIRVGCREEFRRLKLALENQMVAAEWEANWLRGKIRELQENLAAAKEEVLALRVDLEDRGSRVEVRRRPPPRLRVEVSCVCGQGETPALVSVGP